MNSWVCYFQSSPPIILILHHCCSMYLCIFNQNFCPKKRIKHIPQAPFPKLSHPQGTYKSQMTDPARPPGSPVEPQMSKEPSHEVQKHYIEALMKMQLDQQGVVMHIYQCSLSESSLDFLSEICICFSHDTTINGSFQGLQFFLCM